MATVLSQTASRSLRPSHSRPILLSCLYQTKTIQRRAFTEDLAEFDPSEKIREIKDKWSTKKYASETRRGRVRESRTPRAGPKSELLPFEGSTGSANPEGRFENTTMTPRELQLFEDLFRKGIEAKPEENRKQFVRRAAQEFPELLQPLAEEAKGLRDQAALQADAEKKVAGGQTEKFDIQDKQSKKIKALMDDAKTDVQLWQVLEKHIFERLRGLGVDKPIQPAKYTALPALLSHYVSLIQTHFPGSPLGLVLLSELRKLGPSAFALSASTDLYNRHMQMLWKHYTDVDAILEILAEMDKDVYPFNEDTQELVNSIWDYSRAARNGLLGPGLRALWATDRKERALEKLRGWSRIVNERLEAAALRWAQREGASFDQEGVEEEGQKEALPAA